MLSTPARRIARGASVGIGAAAVAFASAIVPLGTAQAADPGTKVNLVTFNDYHGALAPTEDNAPSVGERFACTVTTEQNAERADGATSFLLSAGDNVGGSEFASAVQQDEPTIQLLNALGVLASAAGNHEFDQGQDDFTGRIAKHADFPYVAANVYKADGTRLFEPWAIVDQDGVKVAVVGAVTTKTVIKVSPAAIKGLSFHDPVDEVNKAIDELKASGEDYDMIVASYHEGSDTSADLGSAPKGGGSIFEKIVSQTSPDAAAIFNGDSHRTYAYNAPVAGTDRTRPVIQAGASGAYIGSVTLEAAADGTWSAAAAPELLSTEKTDPASCAGDATYEAASRVVQTALEDAEEAGSKPVGSVAGDITSSWDASKAEYVDGVWTKTVDQKKGDNRGRHSAAGNVLADSEKWFLEEKGLAGDHEVIGWMNPGGIRAELWEAQSSGEGDGVVTYAEANNVVPFGNTLYAGDVTGAQFQQMLEEQWQRGADGADLEKFLAFSVSQNVTYIFDSTADMDQHIRQVFINGKPLDPEATYTIVAASFLFEQGDGMWTMGKATNVRDTGILDRDAFSDYLAANKDLAPDYSQRQIDVQMIQEGEYDAAKGIDQDPVLRLQGLESQSLGAPKIAKVVLDAGEYGTFEAPYQFDDETGRWFGDVTLKDWLCVPEGTEVEVKIATEPDAGTTGLVTLGAFTWSAGGAPDKCQAPSEPEPQPEPEQPKPEQPKPEQPAPADPKPEQPAPAQPGEDTAPVADAPHGDLARTGSESMPLVLGALALMVGGLVAMGHRVSGRRS